MSSKKYLFGLILTVPIIWVTMIICLDIVYYLLYSASWLTDTFRDRLTSNIVGLLVAGFIVFVWLYSWNMFVRGYFLRNLNQTPAKPFEKKGKRKR
jgi:hypothetical protein